MRSGRRDADRDFPCSFKSFAMSCHTGELDTIAAELTPVARAMAFRPKNYTGRLLLLRYYACVTPLTSSRYVLARWDLLFRMASSKSTWVQLRFKKICSS